MRGGSSRGEGARCGREEEEVRTLPVLVVLSVTLSSWSERRGRMLGISPPVACLFPTTPKKVRSLANHITGYRRNKTYQLHRALAKYLFAISLSKILPHPSPVAPGPSVCVTFVALPPLKTVPIRVLTSPVAHQKARSASQSRLENNNTYQLC
jgi:hypothetical protein